MRLRALRILLATSALAALPALPAAALQGIHCERIPARLTERALCEADRATALHYSRLLEFVRDRVLKALATLPDAERGSLAAHLETESRIADWRPPAGGPAWVWREYSRGLLDEAGVGFDAGAWGIRARGCGGRLGWLVAYYRAGSMKERWDGGKVQIAVKEWTASRLVDPGGVPRVLGGAAGSPAARRPDGTEQALDGCLDSAADYGSALPRGGPVFYGAMVWPLDLTPPRPRDPDSLPCTWNHFPVPDRCKPPPQLPLGGNGSGGSGGGSGEDALSYDVDGDNRPDFGSWREAQDYVDANGGRVSTVYTEECQGCTGPQASSGDDGDGGDDSGSGGGGLCFLTTAVTEMRGEADDGPTLTLLRGFRDGWLAGRPDGQALIGEYYRVAPRIVAAVPPGHPEWERIAAEVDLAASQIAAGRPASAFGTYRSMVVRLIRAWLPEGGPGAATATWKETDHEDHPMHGGVHGAAAVRLRVRAGHGEAGDPRRVAGEGGELEPEPPEMAGSAGERHGGGRPGAVRGRGVRVRHGQSGGSASSEILRAGRPFCKLPQRKSRRRPQTDRLALEAGRPGDADRRCAGAAYVPRRGQGGSPQRDLRRGHRRGDDLQAVSRVLVGLEQRPSADAASGGGLDGLPGLPGSGGARGGGQPRPDRAALSGPAGAGSRTADPQAGPRGPGRLPALRALGLAALAAASPSLGAAAGDRAGAAPEPPAQEAGIWLAANSALFRLHSGRRIRLASGADVVPYGPLSALWILNGRTDSPVARAGRVSAQRSAASAAVTVRWEDGTESALIWPELPPEIARVGGIHPLARFHDRLLALPLARSVAGIPAGARFRPDGTVALPAGVHPVSLRWRSLGDAVEITDASGHTDELAWTEVDAALPGTGADR